MPVANLSPADLDWWWQYGLEGIGGGVLGGVVTAGAVWLTLRHERKLNRASEARLHDDALQEDLSALLAGCTNSIRADFGGRKPADMALDLYAAVTAAENRASRVSPALTRDLRAFRHLVLMYTPHGVMLSSARMHAMVQAWIRDPSGYEKLPSQAWPGSEYMRPDAKWPPGHPALESAAEESD